MATMKPVWLPNIISLEGDWERSTLRRLYSIFEQDFIQGKPSFENRPVWWDQRKLDGRFDEGFWHIISTTDRETLERIPDFDRAKRLPWCAPVIINCADPAVKCWDYEEAGGKIRTYVWLEHWDYVIIFQKRRARVGEIAFLITAYHVDGSATRKKLAQKYERRIDAN